MSFKAVEAVQIKSKGRIAIQGPAGSGKTFSALRLAQALGKRVFVIDSERESSSKFAKEWEGFTFYIVGFDPPYDPERYVEAIHYCEDEGADVIIVDSLSHAWAGEGGALEIVDKQTAKAGKNKYYAWRFVTPKHNALVDAMLNSPAHIIGCMRTKTKYVEGEIGGKKTYRKQGMEAVQREGMDYEFDIVLELDLDHNATVSKTRYSEIADKVYTPITEELGEEIKAWLDKGIDRPVPVMTKEDLVELIKGKGFNVNDTIFALKEELGMGEFDPSQWDAMVEFVSKYSVQAE